MSLIQFVTVQFGSLVFIKTPVDLPWVSTVWGLRCCACCAFK